MKIFELLKKGVSLLEENCIDDAQFDAMCLIEKAFEFGRNDYYINRLNEADEDKSEYYLSLIERRIKNEPLQYIIGIWPFMDGEFYVGDGVLIPRQDTETLVEAAAEYIKNNKVKTVVDLCSGSGCIGISLAMMFPNIDVVCIELSKKAFSYLEKNIKLNNVKNVKAINGNIEDGAEKFDIKDIDVLVSNPPYIITKEISLLSREVQNEPFMALDGGEDGFYFYNLIKDKWLYSLKKGSFAGFECGENQARELSKLFDDISSSTQIHNDLNNIQRVVTIIKN